MNNLNTMKDYEKETTKRTNALLSSGDETKIEAYYQGVEVAAQHMRDNYPDAMSVIKDFEQWMAMTKDILTHSTSFMALIFTPEEVADVLAMCDDITKMRSYWEEILEELKDTSVTKH